MQTLLLVLCVVHPQRDLCHLERPRWQLLPELITQLKGLRFIHLVNLFLQQSLSFAGALRDQQRQRHDWYLVLHTPPRVGVRLDLDRRALLATEGCRTTSFAQTLLR